MNKIIYIIFTLSLSLQATAQIGIYTETPNSSSALDIVSTDKGLLLPRMTSTQKDAIVNPAHGLLVYDTNKRCICQNIGTPTAPDWDCLTLFNKQFFYMPSINIDTNLLNINLTKDLYAQYQTEFGTPIINNPGAVSTSIPHYSANELNYYVTYYDPTVIQINSISNTGVMSYKILKEANFDTYMNIVFVIK